MTFILDKIVVSPKKRRNSFIKNFATSGFSLVEVLVSILMIAAFLATALQALISATAIKVKAEELSESTTWMQEDLENIRFEANQMGFVSNAYDADPTKCLNSAYAEDLKDLLVNVPPNPLSTPDPDVPRIMSKVSAMGGRGYLVMRVLQVQAETLQITHRVFKDLDKDQALDFGEDVNGDGILNGIEDVNGNGTLDFGEALIQSQYSEVIPDVTFACG